MEAEPTDQLASLGNLVADMNAGTVDLLVIVSGNPVFTAPADPARRAGKVPLRVHLSLYDDETSALCHWQIPESHFLESWSDARGFDGTASIIQPLIAPLYDSKSAHELIATMSDRPERPAYDLVRDFWSSRSDHACLDVAAAMARWRGYPDMPRSRRSPSRWRPASAAPSRAQRLRPRQQGSRFPFRQ